jgi:YbbR domain-containing protein
VTARELWQRIVFRWPRKLAALALAIVMWAFVTTSDETIAQRSMLVPITVEGISPDVVPIGIPEVAEVTVSGPIQRVDRLRPESIEAVLDLAGRTGNFTAPVSVSPPQGVVLERVNPAEVLGILEPVTARQVPVTVVHLGEPPPDGRLHSVAEPGFVTVRGRRARLDRVTQALVAVEQGEQGEQETVAAPFAADASGRPVEEVSVSPGTVRIVSRVEPLLARREVPLRLVPLVIDHVGDVVPSHETVPVVGPRSVLERLDELVGTIALPTERPAPGRYTLPVNVVPPPGVVLLEEVTASVRYDQPQGAR